MEDLPVKIDITKWTADDRMVKVLIARGRTVMGEIVGFEIWPARGFRAQIILKCVDSFPTGTCPSSRYTLGAEVGQYQFIRIPKDVKEILNPPKKAEDLDFMDDEDEIDAVDPEGKEAPGTEAAPISGAQDSEPEKRADKVSAARTSRLRGDTGPKNGKTSKTSKG